MEGTSAIERAHRELLESRCMSAGYDLDQVVYEDDSLGVTVFCRRAIESDCCIMAGFSGRRGKPDFHLRFASRERADRHMGNWLAGLKTRAERKIASREERKLRLAKPHALCVGDVLYSSWGWEQTNYDYYQVIRLVGARSVELRRLAAERCDTAYLQGKCVPIKGDFIGEPFLARVTENNSVKVKASGVWAFKKEPVMVAGVEVFAPDHYTEYA